MKCGKCQNGVAGMVGHFDLFILRLDASMMQFKCAACGTLWTRPAKLQDPIVWTCSSSEMKGMPVPGWKTRSRSEE